MNCTSTKPCENGRVEKHPATKRLSWGQGSAGGDFCEFAATRLRELLRARHVTHTEEGISNDTPMAHWSH